MTGPARRYAEVRGADAEVVAKYLPRGYRVDGQRESHDDGHPVVFISGVDDAGWTLDGYVLPRLASGMIWAHETFDGPEQS